MNELFCKGYTWGFFSGSGTFMTAEAERSMERLASNGLDWICIPVNCFQEAYYSLNVVSLFGRTQTDEEVIFAIKKAKSLGLKVCLKPMVDCLDHSWRARINFPTETPYYWDRWFASYTRFMLHYAALAERCGCEMLCTGCEMAGMDGQSQRCLKLIEEVRKVYSGIVMHNVNHGDELKFDWLGAVDVIGISAYYPVTSPEDRSLERMKNEWLKRIDVLEKCHKYYGKPVMFAEIGVRNEQGCTQYPWDFHDRPDLPLDEQEQADFYESAMWATWDKPWFSGYFWWDWQAVLPPIEKAKENRDFTVYGKLAEDVLKKWYTK
ncbi:MAG: glycoside hydrolase family 113 [Oscillospiraceae bacterium]